MIYNLDFKGDFMKAFMDKDFLLSTETAKVIFEKGAKDTPIFDWHCHLSPKEIYENHKSTLDSARKHLYNTSDNRTALSREVEGRAR